MGTFVSKVVSLLFNMLSRLIIVFLPKSKHLLIPRLQSPSAVILESKKIKSVTVSIVSPYISHEALGLGAMIFVFWMLSFKPAFSLSSFTFIKRLFSSSLLSAISVVSSAYLRLLIFLPEILIPACASSNPAFHLIYSTYNLNKQDNNSFEYSVPDLEPAHFSVSGSNFCFMTCIQVSQRQERWSGIPISWRIFPFVVIHTVKGFGIVSEAEVDVFLELSCSFYDPVNVPNLISSSSAFSKPSLNIWKFTVHILLKPGLEDFEHYFTSMWDECNCAVVWHSSALPFFGIGMKTDIFQSCGHCWVFQICWHIECSTLTVSSFGICNSSAGIPSTS